MRMITLVVGGVLGFAGGIYLGVHHPELASSLDAQREKWVLEGKKEATEAVSKKLDDLLNNPPAAQGGPTPARASPAARCSAGAARRAGATPPPTPSARCGTSRRSRCRTCRPRSIRWGRSDPTGDPAGRTNRPPLHLPRRRAYPSAMSIRVGIVGVSGYGGGEALRLCATHPAFEVAYVAGESSAGAKLVEKFPGIGKLAELTIQKWDPADLPDLDVLFASLPTGESKDALAASPPAPKSSISAATTASSTAGPTAWPTSGRTRSETPPASPTPAATRPPRWRRSRRWWRGNLVDPANHHHRRQERRQRRRPGRRVGASASPRSTKTSPPTACSSTPTSRR